MLADFSRLQLTEGDLFAVSGQKLAKELAASDNGCSVGKTNHTETQINKSYTFSPLVIHASSAGSLMCCNVWLTHPFYLIQSLAHSVSLSLLHAHYSFTPALCLSQSLSINWRDKPKQICLKPLPSWRSHRNDTYSLSFQTTLMAYWRACRLTDYCICVCMLGAECTLVSVCILIQLLSILYHFRSLRRNLNLSFCPATSNCHTLAWGTTSKIHKHFVKTFWFVVTQLWRSIIVHHSSVKSSFCRDYTVI